MSVFFHMTYLLDLRTIAFIYAAVRLSITVALACLWWSERSYTPARDWALGTFLTAFGLLLIGLRAHVSPLITETISSVFILSGSMIFNMGIVRACNYPLKVKNWYLFCLCSILIVYFLDNSEFFSHLETLVYHSTIIVFQLAALYHCLLFWAQRKMDKRGKTYLAIAALLALSIVVIISKISMEVFGLFPLFSGITPKILHLLFSLMIFPVLVMLLFVQHAQKLQDDLKKQACHDMLTGAYNRRAFSECMDKQWALSTRNKQTISVLSLDIDDFKVFNDKYGHQAGDKALVHVSKVAEEILRTNDIWCRYGGEEFVALLPDTNLLQALTCAERIREAISHAKMEGPKGSLSLSVSIGVAQRTEDINNWSELLFISDAALYDAKASGKNCVKAGTLSNLTCEPSFNITK